MSAGSEATIRRTPLYDVHKEAGARFTEFGGWEMPVQYSGVIDEHNTVRRAAGLFDVSHMGEISVRGPQAFTFLQHAVTNDLSRLHPGEAQYSLLLNEQGGVVDDIIVYQFAADDYFLCVNAANAEKDFQWLNKNKIKDVLVENLSGSYAQLALQGPRAREIIALIPGLDKLDYALAAFPSFTFRRSSVSLAGKSEPVIVASTGYTGEDGFEIFCPPKAVQALWEALMKAGASFGIKPIGLGARDTLRLEACYPLHGHELRDDLPAVGCGVDWVIKLRKPNFIGREALLERIEEGIGYQLIGFEVADAGIVRGDTLLYDEDKQVGWTSSGTKTPTLNKAIGLGFVEPGLSAVGTVLQADVRGRRVSVRVIPRPFYKKGSASA